LLPSKNSTEKVRDTNPSPEKQKPRHSEVTKGRNAVFMQRKQIRENRFNNRCCGDRDD
jgi:hypothetical protein